MIVEGKLVRIVEVVDWIVSYKLGRLTIKHAIYFSKQLVLDIYPKSHYFINSFFKFILGDCQTHEFFFKTTYFLI